ncbi:MAG: hypothetical protein OXN94_04840 [Chloroflexota bacterium]|nr:hypothetical protein [Chloroflexota bacterium]
MDITSAGTFDAVLLDHIARRVMGRATSGISVGGGFSRIHLLNDTAANQRRASDILNHFNTLQLLETRTSMREGEADPVIRCRDQAIANDEDIGYLLMFDGEVYAEGSDSVISGELSLTLSRPAAGSYSVFVYRLRGNYASASVQIVVKAA